MTSIEFETSWSLAGVYYGLEALDGGVTILKFDNDKGRRRRALFILEMEVEQINKGKYEHYMQKEIHEQPESLGTTRRGRLIRGGSCKAKSVMLGGIKDHLKTVRCSRRIVFIGCGTSYNAALAARPILEELSGPNLQEDTAVFVSQSGETADTLQALEYALENGALCVGITNTVGSAIARNTHCGVHINAGAEIGVASTKAYTSQIIVMAMLALAIADDTISKQPRREAIIDGLFDFPNKVRESLLVFGRGYNYATALEGALKVIEVALMHSEGILAGEMRHGPLAFVDGSLYLLLLLPLMMLASVGNPTTSRSQRSFDCDVFKRGCCICLSQWVVLQVDCLQPVINVIPLQLLAYHPTGLRGLNVDQPRNLAKSVTTQ
ncbi:hypothetical protein Cgig2_002063 [Carnegiea gigantea]|uniref:SIS domain-containing protein n=1 Tax=Carnegiea gigantea TaxID=171969 RepID=A0A9Q1JN68_9CARY|nr:hypothetical protein Cgig2_002063 [Carnegiea gigantea]